MRPGRGVVVPHSTVMQRAASCHCGVGEHRRDLLLDRGGGARHQHALAARGHALDDRHDLLGSLAGAEHRLGEAASQCAMVVDLGEAEVLVGERRQAARRLVGAHPPVPHALEKLLDAARIH